MARMEEATFTRFDRKTFLEEVWDYSPGEQVTILVPTGGGKTYLGCQLLMHSATEECPAIVFVMKGEDETLDEWMPKMKFRLTRDWPPAVTKRLFSERKPRGWILWPAETGDPDIDDPRNRAIFRRAIIDSYRKGDRILFADETYSLEEELSLTRELRMVWTKGRSKRCGLWAASQRPAYISKWAYQAHHLFLGPDPDEDTQRRLSEIGGAISPGKVRHGLTQLGENEFLYVNRDERGMCIVGA